MNPARRILFVAWQDPRTRAIYPVARIAELPDRVGLEFVYVGGVQDALRAGFAPFPGMRQLEASYFAESVASFPLLANRLMPESRPDFEDYVRRLGLEGVPEPLALLARSEARKATDSLELFAPPEFDSATGEWAYSTFLRGVRHVQGSEAAIGELRAGSALKIERDTENTWDGRALRVVTLGGSHIGWVPGALLDDLHQVLSGGHGILIRVNRVNLPPAPVSQRVLLELRAPDGHEFVPMSGATYQPLASEAAPTHIDSTPRLR